MRRSRCLLVIEQFWTANYWHWLTDALPKALLFIEMRDAAQLDPECKGLAYDLGGNLPYLQLAGFEAGQLLPYDPTAVHHAHLLSPQRRTHLVRAHQLGRQGLLKEVLYARVSRLVSTWWLPCVRPS